MTTQRRSTAACSGSAGGYIQNSIDSYGAGKDKKKRTRCNMTQVEYSKHHRTESIAVIFKKSSVKDNEVAPTAPDAQLDAGIEQENDSDDAGGDEGGQKADAVSRESVPQPSPNQSKGEELQIQQPPNSHSTSTAITIEDQRFSLTAVGTSNLCLLY